jgi:hypothetical protein
LGKVYLLKITGFVSHKERKECNGRKALASLHSLRSLRETDPQERLLPNNPYLSTSPLSTFYQLKKNL